jgi:hypothetical protein
MSQRPDQNWEARSLWSMGPKFRIDTNNPRMGFNGSSVYNLYALTDNNDIHLEGLTEGGKYQLYNDRDIEIVAGYKNESDGVDITITGLNGDICITACRNGAVRIKGKNIMIEADEDIDLKAGRNITFKSGSGRVLTDANKIDVKALAGNIIENTFGVKVFEGSFVGSDIITGAFSAGEALIGGV